MVDAGFLAALAAIPAGHSRGRFAGKRWGTTLDVSADGRRRWLYAEALDGSDHVSFNLYALASGPALRPCEMAAGKVVAFVRGYVPERDAGERSAPPPVLTA